MPVVALVVLVDHEAATASENDQSRPWFQHSQQAMWQEVQQAEIPQKDISKIPGFDKVSEIPPEQEARTVRSAMRKCKTMKLKSCPAVRLE